MYLSTSCVHCHQRIEWVDCPTGGWWSHVKHPDDGHDAEAWFDVWQKMDDRGYYETDYLRVISHVERLGHHTEVHIPEPRKSPPELKLEPTNGHLREGL